MPMQPYDAMENPDMPPPPPLQLQPGGFDSDRAWFNPDYPQQQWYQVSTKDIVTQRKHVLTN